MTDAYFTAVVRLGLASLVGGACFWPLTAQAQITPDQTLGTESSVITPGTLNGLPTDLINGGAIRDANLFHSFQEFNVQELQRVYFSNPQGIINILSRVTGNDPSNILGTLGVDGPASLYLINPNGIIFGSNAQLDVNGSFLASTSDRFTFVDGSEFRATNPNQAPLVTVSVAPGVQFGSDAPQPIFSEANLTAGQDLSLIAGAVTSTGAIAAPQGQVNLAAVAGDAIVQDVTAQSATLSATGNLILNESQLQTTEDLNLIARDTVQIRDSEAASFRAIAGGNLRIQGDRLIDILALSNRQSTLAAGGQLALVGDGVISTDAHFYGGAGVSITQLDGSPANFVSLYDPIISANGDVEFGDYTGASLKVEATGSISGNSITIDGPDTGLPATFTGNVNLAELGTNFRGEFSTAGGAVPVNGGDSLQTFLNFDLNTDGTTSLNGTAQEGSALRQAFQATAAGQTVTFDWEFTTGEGAGSIYNDYAFFTLTDAGGNVVAAAPQTLANNSSGGTASGTLLFSVPAAGFYTLGAGVVDVVDGAVDSSLRVTNVLLDNLPIAVGDHEILAAGPAVILRAGAVLTNPPNLPQSIGGTDFTVPGSGLTNNIEITGNITTTPAAGNAGPVILDAQGDVLVQGSINASAPTTDSGGNGGQIQITSALGNITVQPVTDRQPIQLNTTSTNGSGGNVLLQAPNGEIRLQTTEVITDTSGSGNAGQIRLDGNRLILDDSNLSAVIGDAAANFDTQIFLFDSTGALLSQNDDSSTVDGAGGSAGLSFNPNLTRDSFLTYNFDTAGTYYLGVGAYYTSPSSGNPDAPLSGNTLSEGDYRLQFSLDIPDFSSDGRGSGLVTEVEGNDTFSSAQVLDSANFVTSANDNIANATTIPHLSVVATGDNTYDYFQFDVPEPTPGEAIQGIFDIDSGLSGTTAGNIFLTASGDIDLNNSQVDASTLGGGRGGRIVVTSNEGGNINLNGSQIDASTLGVGDGGRVNLTSETGNIRLNNGSSVRTTVGQGASGQGGDISIRASSVGLNNGSVLNAENNGLGVGGSVLVEGQTLVSLTDNSSIRTTVGSQGRGNGGDINVNTPTFLEVLGGSRIEAQTFGNRDLSDPASPLQANAGNIFINAATGNVNVSGFNQSGIVSGLFTSTEGSNSGTGGSIAVNTSGLNVSNQAVLSARTLNARDSGSIQVNVDRLNVASGGQLITTAETSSTGQAGDIIVIASERVDIDGEAIAFVPPSSPFEAIAAFGDIELTSFNLCTTPGSCPTDIEQSDRIPYTSLSETGDGTFQYYGFSIRTPGGRGIFDIDGGYELDGDNNTTASSVDTQIFLFNWDTGELLTQNDDEFVSRGAEGSTGLAFFPDYSRDSYIQYNFAAPGNYVLGVAQYPTFAGFDQTTGPLETFDSQTPVSDGQTYTLQVSVQGQGNLDGLNPNQGLNSGLFAQALGSSEAGQIRINAPTVTVTNGGQVLAETNSGGADRPALIQLDGLDTLTVNDGFISSSTTDGVAGDVVVSANRSIDVTDGLISSSAAGAVGEAGNVSLTANEAINLAGSFLNPLTTDPTRAGVAAAATAGGNAGRLDLVTSTLSLSNGAQAGVASLNGSGSAGTLSITADTVNLREQSQIIASTDAGGEGSPASIELNGLRYLDATDGSQILASTSSGVAGNISINVDEAPAEIIRLSGTPATLDQDALGGIIARATNGGRAGNVSLNTQELSVTNAAQITASSADTDIDGVGPDTDGISTRTAGTVDITSQTIALDGGLISTTNEQAPQTGTIDIDGDGVNDSFGNIILRGVSTLSATNSLIAASTDSGFAGSVTINGGEAAAQSVTFTGTFGVFDGQALGGLVAAGRQGGSAGSVLINTETLNLQDQAIAAVSATGDGSAGDLTVLANTVTLNNQAGLVATTDNGSGGSIELRQLNNLLVNNNSRIEASTNTGVAGSVQIGDSSSPTENILIAGSSDISVSANGSNARAGDIAINGRNVLVQSAAAPNNFSFASFNFRGALLQVLSGGIGSVPQTDSDRSRIRVDNPSGVAGSLEITADYLGLSGGVLQATSGLSGNNAATITIDLSRDPALGNFLALANESLIEANALNNASGGNINITADLVFGAFPTGASGSDIIANATEGRGGNIAINTLVIFGLEFRDFLTPLNDITANSLSGEAGTVQITTLGIDPSRGLSEVPLAFVDATDLVGDRCAPVSGEASQFTVAGRGGIPTNPTQPLSPTLDTSDWVTLDTLDPVTLDPNQFTSVALQLSSGQCLRAWRVATGK